MGGGARFCPPWAGWAASGAPSIAKTWPLPVSATKPMPDRVPAPPVQLTVHSIAVLCWSVVFLPAFAQICPSKYGFAAPQQDLRYTSRHALLVQTMNPSRWQQAQAPVTHRLSPPSPQRMD